VGLLLLVLPWSEFWENNYFALGWPILGSILTNNFVRGGISGLGVVNLIVGVTDLTMVLSSRERNPERSSISLRDSTGP
jgi:ABC-type transport system involved in cytochrome c biogenesis permease subunit